MTTINQLPLLTTLSGGDNLVVWSPNNGDSRRVPYSFIKADIRAGLISTEAGVINVQAAPYNTPANGIGDATAGLAAAFAAGGDIYIPEGNYRIAGTGPDSGGVSISLVRSLRVRCHPNAVFIADNLDNDMIRMTVPEDGTGVPAGGVTVIWDGGTFNQTNQKVSTSVPFIGDYPPPAGKVGTSATCDGLSIKGIYTIAGVNYNGISLCLISNMKATGGTHWQTAGGDSGIFASGAVMLDIHDCIFTGNRDLGIYASAGGAVRLDCKTTIYNNQFINCFFGAAMKRSGNYTSFYGNHAENCVIGFTMSLVSGPGFLGAAVTNNTANKCGTFLRSGLCTNLVVQGNRVSSLGAVLADGVTIEPVVGCNGILLRGDTRCLVADNVFDGETAGAAAAYPSTRAMLVADDLDGVPTTYTTFSQNIGNGLRIAGTDSGVGNVGNRFIENVVYNPGSSSGVPTVAADTYVVAIDPATNDNVFRSATAFVDGTTAAPTIYRFGQTNVGIGFDTNAVFLASNSTQRVAVNNLGVGFNGAAAVARPTYAAPTGTATRTTFDTATVTTAQLAERVKAMIDDVRVYGLFG